MDLFKLSQILTEVRKELGEYLTVTQLNIIVLVAAQPGITHGEIAKRLNMVQGSVSRNCSRLSEHSRYGRNKGYGLIVPKIDLKISSGRYAMYLTQKGKGVIKMVEGMLQ